MRQPAADLSLSIAVLSLGAGEEMCLDDNMTFIADKKKS